LESGENDMLPARLQFTLIIAIVFYFIMMCIFLKNKALSLKYTLLWILAGIVMSLLVIVPDILVYLNHLVGIQSGTQSNMNGLFIWAIVFIVCILLSLTSIVSRQNNKIRQLVQTISRLEKRVRELEEEKSVND
jgi:hypothetical protein